MTREASYAVLAVTTLLFVGLQLHIVRARTRGRPDRSEWLKGLFLPAAATSAAFLIVGLAFCQELAAQWAADQAAARELTRFWLLRQQLGVFVATAGVMELLRRGLASPEALAHAPREAGVITQLVTYETVARRYWIHALGGLILGGLATGVGPALMLAAEITVSWAMFRAAAWALGIPSR